MDSATISRRFIEYYQGEGFRLLPRAPMLDDSIPMSFVMSAGLVQIETSLAGEANRDGNQFVLVQNCFRHFDLGTVGKDSTHLSFFEMPGAFTFGPNNKPITIQRMWFLATEVLGLPKEREAEYHAKQPGGHKALSVMEEQTIVHQNVSQWHGTAWDRTSD